MLMKFSVVVVVVMMIATHLLLLVSVLSPSVQVSLQVIGVHLAHDIGVLMAPGPVILVVSCGGGLPWIGSVGGAGAPRNRRVSRGRFKLEGVPVILCQSHLEKGLGVTHELVDISFSCILEIISSQFTFLPVMNFILANLPIHPWGKVCFSSIIFWLAPFMAHSLLNLGSLIFHPFLFLGSNPFSSNRISWPLKKR